MTNGRWLMRLGIVAGASLVGACTPEERVRRPLPVEVVLTAATGEYRIVYDPERFLPDVPAPEYIPLVTESGGRRHGGLLLDRSTPGYHRLTPDGAIADIWAARLLIPCSIHPRGTSWRLESYEFRILGSVVRRSEKEPLTIEVAVDPPGPERPKPLRLPEGVMWER